MATSTFSRRNSMKPAATISAALHLLVLLAVIVVIPAPLPPPPPPDDAMEVEFDGTAASAQKSQNHGQVAAPAEAEQPADENPALVAPKPRPLEHAPPPPPPPPPPAQAAAAQVHVLDAARIPLPPPEKDAIALKPPPPMKLAAPPPPKMVPTQTPVKKPVADPTQAKPMDTVRHQQNQTRNPAPDTHSLMNTLDKMLADDQKQTAPPTHTYNPSRNGARNAGGQVHGNLTGSLTQGQRKTIGDSVRKCYSEDTAAKDYLSYYADMEVMVDAQGTVHDVKLLPAFQTRANADPAYRAFAERAEHAVLDPQCATLPLPAGKLGQPSQTLTFRFRP